MHDELGRRRLLKKLILVGKALLVVTVIAGSLLVATSLPTHLASTESVVIHAPASRIVPLVTDLHRWQDWSVWSQKFDPQTSNTFEGPSVGVGSSWSWTGSEGRSATFTTESVTQSEIRIGTSGLRLVHTANISFAAEGDETRVSWETLGMGPLFIAWLSGSVIDRHLADVKTSLNNLKTVVEAAN